MIAWIKFTYFTFYVYHRKNLDHTDAGFRAVMIIGLQLFLLFLSFAGLFNIFYPEFKITSYFTRFWTLFFSCLMLVPIYFIFMHNKDEENILNEFENHPLNTIKNRRLCYFICIITIVLFLLIGMISKRIFTFETIKF